MPGMKCREFEGVLVEMARRSPLMGDEGARLTAHLDGCEHCRIVLNGQLRLSAVSQVLAAEAARFSAPASVEHALLREMANVHRLRRRRIVYSVETGAMAAALALTVWMTHRPGPAKPAGAIVTVAPPAPQPAVVATVQPVSKRRKRVVKRPAAEQEQPFVAIPYTLPLQPYERADVMRMDVPVAALIAVGLPMNMADPSALARADVLVGQDGRARAIRLVSVSAASISSN